MDAQISFSVNFLAIFQVFLAFCWGITWALCLQHTRRGRWIAEERTWIAVVIGVGVDLAISFGGDWWLVSSVVAASSIGIIVRSIYNEQEREKRVLGRNKMQWVLEDIVARSGEVVKYINQAMECQDGKCIQLLSLALQKAHKTEHQARCARNGEYVE